MVGISQKSNDIFHAVFQGSTSDLALSVLSKVESIDNSYSSNHNIEATNLKTLHFPIILKSKRRKRLTLQEAVVKKSKEDSSGSGLPIINNTQEARIL